MAPRLKLYFGNGWNLFDFTIILLALLPATGEFAMVARLARLLRVLRLISTIPELRLIVATLMRSIPSMGTFVIINLFIAVVINNLEEPKQESLAALREPLSSDALIQELDRTQKVLQQLQDQLATTRSDRGG